MKKYRDLVLIPLIFLLVWLALRWYRSPGVKHGAMAPHFSGYSIYTKDSIRLGDFRGKMLLIDFWGSWCGPCRQANKELVELYKSFRDANFVDGEEGFEILSIGIETKEEPWRRAIEKDRLVWQYHLVDFDRFDAELPKLYGIKEIPTSFLVDGKGQVLAVNASAAQLRASLDRLRKD